MSQRALAALVSLSTVFSLTALPPAAAEPRDRADLEPARAVVTRENPFKGLEAGIFIVSLDDPAIALYEGGIRRLRPTSTRGEVQLDVDQPAAVAYRDHLESQQATLISRLNRDLGRPVNARHTYFNAANAIAVQLTPDEAARVSRMPGVRSVMPDTVRHIHTDAGPDWISAPAIWDGTATGMQTRGEGIVIGVLDTGINPQNPSFADVGGDGFDHTNPLGTGTYVGVCNPSEAVHQPGFACNDKLIGAWNFTNGPGPLDDEGHGSHTAGTAAGNVVEAEVVAPTLTISPTISGVAPHANIIVYDVCTPAGCRASAILAAIDQAIADGVDVINYSIGDETPTDPWAESEQLSWLAAREAGIFVAHSAGNEGPNAATTGSPNAPWMTHVTATSHARRFTNSVGDFSGGESPLGDIAGVGIAAGYGPAPIVYAGDYPSDLTDTPELCGVGLLGDEVPPWPAGTFTNEIVVCDRGTYGRVEKGTNVLAAGAGGFVLADNGAGLVSDSHDLPGLHVSRPEGDLLKAWLASGTGHVATIRGAVQEVADANGDVLVEFSSRGPNTGIDIISPNLAAPGGNIIAAHGTDGEIGWGFRSGTSMASPHVAGAAALLKSLYPHWTPAEIESALMLTASQTVLLENGATPATPFDSGAGRIDVSAAAQTGLVMNETVADYMAANPRAGGDVSTINLASMADSSCLTTCSWTRTVTATREASWTASVAGDDGLALTVSPSRFSLSEGESQDITVTADVSAVSVRQHVFGSLILEPEESSGGDTPPRATMAIAVLGRNGDLPSQVHIPTRRNAGSWEIAGLTALEITDLAITVEGLEKGHLDDAAISADTNPADVFDDVTDGTYLELIDVPAGSTGLIAEILASESPDLDMFMGRDLNDDGVPTESELSCVSASGTALESCRVDEPAAGRWWVLVQNWQSSAPGARDKLTLSTAVLDGTDAGNMRVDGPAAVGHLEPFDLTIYWDDATLEQGDRLYGAFSVGTDPARAGNLGRVVVTVDRLPDDVSKTASQDLAMAGDTVTYEITLQPNVSGGDLEYSINDTIPDGLTYVAGSATNGATIADGRLSWTGTVASPDVGAGEYEMSTNAEDAGCESPFDGGGYVDLEEQGIVTDRWIVGDTVAFTAFEDTAVSFYGAVHAGIGLTDDGFVVFDVDTNYGSTPWIPQAMPDPEAPNNLVALLWQDFEIFHDEATNAGVSLATLDDDSLLVVEFDDLQLFGGSEPVMDMEILMRPTVDHSPGAWEILLAYDNVARSVPGRVGVENADGSAATLIDPSVIADGAMVCFDWAGPSFEPIVISYDVTVDADAPLGLLTNEVVSETDGPGSRAATTAAQVRIVDSPSRTLATSLAQLTDWVENPPADLSPEDVARLAAARDHVADAMAAERWVNETTLDPTAGRRVFTHLQRAVSDLRKMTLDTSVRVGKNTIKRGLVDVAEHLAQLALEDASAANATHANLRRAARKLALIDVDQSNRKWQRAIGNGRRSWVAATRHLR